MLEALAKIATSGRRLSFIDAGDAAADRLDFETAMTQYDNAMKLGVDEELTGKLTSARVQVQLARSRELLDAGRIEEATELVNQAKRFKDLERENQRLRKAVSDLTLDKMILEEASRGNF